MVEGEGEGVFKIGKDGGSEMRNGVREFIEEKGLAWGK